MIRVLSLGAGVQSSTVLLMSCRGDLPKLDAAIFADTKWESRETYSHLEWLKEQAASSGIPLHVVSAGDLRSDALRSKVRVLKTEDVRWMSIPLHTIDANGGGVIKRQCTKEYKIQPIQRFIKQELLGLKSRQRIPKDILVEQWFGISSNEASRMKTSSESWIRNEYPLCNFPTSILPHTFSRSDCLDWIERFYPGRIVPRSACLGCPFRNTSDWRTIKKNPIYWKDVTEFDRSIRHSGGDRGELFLHFSRIPLEDVDFRTVEDQGQLNLFENECSGHCGV
jgi:hypothetical protein